MQTRPLRTLVAAATGVHAADQLALAAIPLAATLALGGDAGMVGLLVAAQSGAWLIVSLPAGVAVDRVDRRILLAGAPLLGAAAFLGAAAAVALGLPLALAVAVLLASAATVAFVLAGYAAVPGLAPADRLPAANAGLELARALATLAAPLAAGAVAASGRSGLAFLLAALAALAAAGAARRLPALRLRGVAPRAPVAAAIREGWAFVLGHPMLRAIALCAVTWNAAYFALAAVLVPFALGPLGLDAADIGLALAAYGGGQVAGACAAPRLAGRVPVGALLVFGPAVSVAAILLVAAAPALAARGVPALAAVAAAQVLFGFGPMLWQISQTSLRQRVTPPALLGRVGATLQTAVFGARPLGALAGGAVATTFGLEATLAAAAIGFAVSLWAVAASPLARLRGLPLPA